jgi:hypothetical protein
MIKGSSDDWDAECDARTLADAESIKQDPQRFGRAQKAAERLAKEAKDRADALEKISDPKSWYKAISAKRDDAKG